MTDEIAAETAKYRKAWSYDRYRKVAPGEALVGAAATIMGCRAGETLIDWGCGTGRAAAAFQALGMKVTGFDIADNCLDSAVDVPLVVGCLWDPPPGLSALYGYCTDVLEHIPPKQVGPVLDGIAERTRKAAFFQVATFHDGFGKVLGEPLHLTVRPADWWLGRLEKRWRVVTRSGDDKRPQFVCWR